MQDAIDKMDIYQFPALVVINDLDLPFAVLTEGDICRAVVERGNVSSLAAEPAHIYASKDPVLARPEMEISDALHLMLSRGITILPVCDDTTFFGIVLRTDLMQAMLTDLAQSKS